jgi:hypothetical protein
MFLEVTNVTKVTRVTRVTKVRSYHYKVVHMLKLLRIICLNINILRTLNIFKMINNHINFRHSEL